MNKEELISKMQTRSGMTPEQINGFLLLFADEVAQSLARGEEVTLADFGSMKKENETLTFSAGDSLKAQHNLTALTDSVFPQGPKNEAYANYFSGQSYLQGLVADRALPFGVGQVTFEPGCRNHWHIHKNGYQVLLVTAGEGWYQEEGQPARKIQTGDVVVTHDGVKHWHGATADSAMSHIAITAGEAVWLEAVSDELYGGLDGWKK